MREQLVGELFDPFEHPDLRSPPRGDRVHAVQRACELAVDGGRGVGVVAEVDGEQDAFLEGSGLHQRPQRCLERFDDVARALDGRRLVGQERAGRDRGNLGVQWLLVPDAGRGFEGTLVEKLADVRSAECPDEQAGEVRVASIA